MVRLWRATAVAVTVLAVALGVAVGYAQGQLAAFRIRGGDGSIYVDVSGAYAFPLPYPVSGFTFLLNYSSTYIQPRLYREIARATIQPEVAVRLGYLSVRLDYSSESGVESAGVKASYTSPAGSALLEVGIRASRVGFEVGVLATGRLLVDKGLLPEDLRARLVSLVSTLRDAGAERLSKQLAEAGVTWFKVEELEVDLADLGRSFEVPFRFTGVLDYADYATKYGVDLGTLGECLNLHEVVSTSATLKLDLTPLGVELEYSAARSAEDLERAYVELARCSREVFRESAPYVPLPTPGPATEVPPQVYGSLSRLQNLSAGLTLLPSNSTASFKVEVGNYVGVYVDVRNVRVTHVDGVEKAAAAVLALADTLARFQLNVMVERGGVPLDPDYSRELNEAVTGLVNTFLAVQLCWAPTPLPPIPLPTPPVATTVIVPATVPVTVVAEAVVRSETVTTSQPPTGYELGHLVAVGVVALAVGIALGYIARGKRS